MDCTQNSAFDAVENDDQFLNDPSLFRDELPQPFRMINKVLDEILETTWDVIVDRYTLALQKAYRKQAPQCDCAMLQVML